uniref:glucan endo-1,3-beta-D-glucosidase n=1 Tax=Picea sitchensis TaxID=3332 RepID=B8LR54_PICSI|nr:unknown [Picea sitchensis]
MGTSVMGRGGLKMSCLWVLVLLSGLALSNAQSKISSSTTGINYGQVADNLASPELVVGLLQTNSINKVKLYSVNETVLKAFANTGIELIVGMGNEDVGNMTDPTKATEWVNENIKAYLPATKIRGIAVGNEVYTGTDTQLMANLVPAMKNIHSALVSIGADTNIKITTPHSLAVLGNSFPPSAGSFASDLKSLMKPLLDLLSQIGSPFFINAYPYFAYKGDPSQISLNYVLFEPNSGVVDPNNNIRYNNMLYAQVDAVYSALSALGYTNIEVTVSETGWPSKGDANEAGATLQNAQSYNGNLLQLLAQNQGTPLRPKLVLQAYLFALFNEDMKPGPASERNYGLFKPDGTAVYNLGLTGTLSTGSSSTGSSSTGSTSTGSFSTGSPPPAIYPNSPTDSSYSYYSSAKETCSVISFYNHLQLLCLSTFLVVLLFLP